MSSESGCNPISSGTEPNSGGSNIAYDGICILDHAGDPTGIRAMQDHKRTKVCPFEKINEVAHGHAKRKQKIEKLHEGLSDILVKLYSESPSKDRVIEYGKQWFKNPNSRWEDSVTHNCQNGKKVIEGKFAADNEKAYQELFSKFALQVDLYDQLSQDKAIGRAAMYRRIANPSDAKIIGNRNDTPTGCETPLWRKACYIMAPMLLFAIAFSIQSFLLHVATHFYVKYMETGPASRREGEGMLFDVVAESVASVVRGFTNVDEGAVTKGRIAFPLWVLDASGIIPAVMSSCAFFRSYIQGHFHIGLWTKAFIVASIVAVAKGVFDAVTIMPDSIGWEACKERLTDDGLEQMRSVHWRRNFLTSGLFKALANEVLGIHGGARVRYCADMMVSGHTYFACVFALSAYKQIEYNTDFFSFFGRKLPPGCHAVMVKVVMVSLGLCVVAEVLLVSLARFHYTVDMLVAIMLVCLLFDSIHVEQWAADWSVGYKWGGGTMQVDDGNGQKKDRKVLPSNSHEITNFRKFRVYESEDDEDDVENPKPLGGGTRDSREYSQLAQEPLAKQ